jgi:hypothetical protein
MKKIIFILILFCSFSHKANNIQIDKNKFFIKELNYRDFSLQKLLGWIYYIDELKLVDSLDYIYVKERESCSSSEYYYYSIFDTTNYYLYVYFYFHEYARAFVLVNYDKNGKYIDDVVISSEGGDAGYFYDSEGIFINDSTIIRNDDEGYYKEFDIYPEFNELKKVDENDSIAFISRCKLKIVLKKDGRILTDTLQCLKK